MPFYKLQKLHQESHKYLNTFSLHQPFVSLRYKVFCNFYAVMTCKNLNPIGLTLSYFHVLSLALDFSTEIICYHVETYINCRKRMWTIEIFRVNVDWGSVLWNGVRLSPQLVRRGRRHSTTVERCAHSINSSAALGRCVD